MFPGLRGPTLTHPKAMQITLTPENSDRLAEHCDLIGWTPDELANHLLADSLDWFADVRSGIHERFLDSTEIGSWSKVRIFDRREAV